MHKKDHKHKMCQEELLAKIHKQDHKQRTINFEIITS